MTEIIYNGTKDDELHELYVNVLNQIKHKGLALVGSIFDFKYFDNMCENEGIKYIKKSTVAGFILAINLQN